MANLYYNTQTLDDITKLLATKGCYSEFKLQEDVQVTPSDETQVITATTEYDGLYSVIVEGDADLNPDNIRIGKSIFGVAGGFKGIDTTDANATASDILKGKSAYAGGVRLEGELQSTTMTYDNATHTLTITTNE